MRDSTQVRDSACRDVLFNGGCDRRVGGTLPILDRGLPNVAWNFGLKLFRVALILSCAAVGGVLAGGILPILCRQFYFVALLEQARFRARQGGRIPPFREPRRCSNSAAVHLPTSMEGMPMTAEFVLARDCASSQREASAPKVCTSSAAPAVPRDALPASMPALMPPGPEPCLPSQPASGKPTGSGSEAMEP